MQLYWKEMERKVRQAAAMLAVGGLLVFSACGGSERTPNDGVGAGTQGDESTSPAQGPYTGAGQGTADGADTLGNHPPTSTDGMGAGTGVGTGEAAGSSSQTADTVSTTQAVGPDSAADVRKANEQQMQRNKKNADRPQPKR